MFPKYIFYLGFILYLKKCNTESVAFISTEHPVVSWFDPNYFKNVTLISRRRNREDPRYYVDLHLDILFKVDNNIKLDFYFYQFLTNRYKPSFIEMHSDFCEMLRSDIIFGLPMKMALHNKTCPFPPGQYHLQNMIIPEVPKGFPFNKGRIYCNGTFDNGKVKKFLLSGSIDMEIKLAKIKTKG